jgi:hypothetical protein
MEDKKMNKISKKWKPVAWAWLGNKQGKHCHWCEFMDSEDGEVTCGNPESKFCDGNRIRTWDGLQCAKECGHFILNEWYTKDENYDSTFKNSK